MDKHFAETMRTAQPGQDLFKGGLIDQAKWIRTQFSDREYEARQALGADVPEAWKLFQEASCHVREREFLVESGKAYLRWVAEGIWTQGDLDDLSFAYDDREEERKEREVALKKAANEKLKREAEARGETFVADEDLPRRGLLGFVFLPKDCDLEPEEEWFDEQTGLEYTVQRGERPWGMRHMGSIVVEEGLVADYVWVYPGGGCPY